MEAFLEKYDLDFQEWIEEHQYFFDYADTIIPSQPNDAGAQKLAKMLKEGISTKTNNYSSATRVTCGGSNSDSIYEIKLDPNNDQDKCQIRQYFDELPKDGENVIVDGADYLKQSGKCTLPDNGGKVELQEATATDNRDDHLAGNGIDGNKDTYFALKGGSTDGYWQS